MTEKRRLRLVAVAACSIVMSMCVASEGLAQGSRLRVDELAVNLGFTVQQATASDVAVASVAPVGRAAAVGLRSGDVILEIEGQQVTTRQQDIAIVAATNPEKRLAMKLSRDGNVYSVAIPLLAPVPATVRQAEIVVESQAAPPVVVTPPAAAPVVVEPAAAPVRVPVRVDEVVPARVEPPVVARTDWFGAVVAELDGGRIAISEVARGSVAETAGLMRGDIILRVDERLIRSMEDLLVEQKNLSARMATGVTFDMAVRRGAEERVVKVAVPAASARVVDIPRTAEGDYVIFCMALRPLASGLQVTGVREGSPPARAGIRPGDVITHIGETVADSPAGMLTAIRQHPEGSASTFTLIRDQMRFTASVTMGPCGSEPAAVVDDAVVLELRREVSALSQQVLELRRAMEVMSQRLEALTTNR